MSGTVTGLTYIYTPSTHALSINATVTMPDNTQRPFSATLQGVQYDYAAWWISQYTTGARLVNGATNPLGAPALSTTGTGLTGTYHASYTWATSTVGSWAGGETLPSPSNSIALTNQGISALPPTPNYAPGAATAIKWYLSTTPVGILNPGTYGYTVTATNAGGETTASAEVTVTNATTNTGYANTVSWGTVTNATGYKIYGRRAGAEVLLATVGAVTSWIDYGTAIASSATVPPTTNTTSPACVVPTISSVTSSNASSLAYVAQTAVTGGAAAAATTLATAGSGAAPTTNTSIQVADVARIYPLFAIGQLYTGAASAPPSTTSGTGPDLGA